MDGWRVCVGTDQSSSLRVCVLCDQPKLEPVDPVSPAGSSSETLMGRQICTRGSPTLQVGSRFSIFLDVHNNYSIYHLLNCVCVCV